MPISTGTWIEGWIFSGPGGVSIPATIKAGGAATGTNTQGTNVGQQRTNGAGYLAGLVAANMANRLGTCVGVWNPDSDEMDY
jgi:hypothetical protein